MFEARAYSPSNCGDIDTSWPKESWWVHQHSILPLLRNIRKHWRPGNASDCCTPSRCASNFTTGRITSGNFDWSSYLKRYLDIVFKLQELIDNESYCFWVPYQLFLGHRVWHILNQTMIWESCIFWVICVYFLCLKLYKWLEGFRKHALKRVQTSYVKIMTI